MHLVSVTGGDADAPAAGARGPRAAALRLSGAHASKHSQQGDNTGLSSGGFDLRGVVRGKQPSRMHLAAELPSLRFLYSSFPGEGDKGVRT